MKHIFFLLICTLVSTAQPYTTDIVYKFTVEHSQKNVEDILELRLTSGWGNSIDGAGWFFMSESPLAKSKMESELRQSDKGVKLESPRTNYLDKTVYLPHPQVKFPLTLGDSIYIEQTELKDYKARDSVSIRGYLKVVDLVYYTNENVVGSVWKIKAVNLDNPKYNAVYYYSDELGFVYFNYLLGDYRVEMNFDGANLR